MRVGTNLFGAYQLLQTAFNVWGGVARLGHTPETGEVLVNDVLTETYILRRKPNKELQFTLM